MKHLAVLFFVLCSFQTYSQDWNINQKVDYLITNKISSIDKVDSVLRKNRKNKNDLEVLLKKSKKAKYKYGLYYACNALGRHYRDRSLFDKSLEEYQKSLKLARELNLLLYELKNLNAIGSVYRRQDDVRNALNYHQEALDKALAVENPDVDIKKTISISQNSLGNIYISLKQYKLALNEFNKAIIVQKELNHNLGLAINYQNIGIANEELGNLDEALKNYNTSLKFNQNLNSTVGKIICGYSIAKVLIKKKKYKEALNRVEEVLPLAIKEDDKYYLSNTYNVLGIAQLYNNKLSLAKENLNIGLDIAEEYNVPAVIVKSHENLAIVHEKREEYQKAYKHYKKAKEEELKTFNERNLLYVSELITKYDKERADNQIKSLAKQNEIAQLQITRNRNLWILALSILILIAVVIFSIDRQKALKNEKKVLSLKQDALRSQMNPHFMFNALNSIKLYIINNDQKKATNYLNKFSKLMRAILDASSVQVTSLEEELKTMDLYMTIENIRFSNEIQYEVDIEKDLNLSQIKLPPLLLQPFIENAIWHGLSTKKEDKKLSIFVKKVSEEQLQIQVVDNGIGRQAAEKIKAQKSIKRKSVGIELTKQRLASFAKNLKTNYSIRYFDLKDEKENSSGTKVSIRLPMV